MCISLNIKYCIFVLSTRIIVYFTLDNIVTPGNDIRYRFPMIARRESLLRVSALALSQRLRRSAPRRWVDGWNYESPLNIILRRLYLLMDLNYFVGFKYLCLKFEHSSWDWPPANCTPEIQCTTIAKITIKVLEQIIHWLEIHTLLLSVRNKLDSWSLEINQILNRPSDLNWGFWALEINQIFKLTTLSTGD